MWWAIGPAEEISLETHGAVNVLSAQVHQVHQVHQVITSSPLCITANICVERAPGAGAKEPFKAHRLQVCRGESTMSCTCFVHLSWMFLNVFLDFLSVSPGF